MNPSVCGAGVSLVGDVRRSAIGLRHLKLGGAYVQSEHVGKVWRKEDGALARTAAHVHRQAEWARRLTDTAKFFMTFPGRIFPPLGSSR